MTRIISGLGEIADRYDAFFIDLWGTVHDGIKPYDGTTETLKRLRDAGKRVILLSNVPRRSSAAKKNLPQVGVADELYDGVITAGEAAWRALAERPDAWHQSLGHRAHVVGAWGWDESMAEGNAITVTPDLNDAEFVLALGPIDWKVPLAGHEDLLQSAKARNLKLLSANPDMTVMRGDQILVCAGSIAVRYQAIGGDMRQHGKPYGAIYDLAREAAGGIKPDRILAIGDTMATDIAGGAAHGIDTAFIPGAIHGPDFGIAMGQTPREDQLATFLSRHDAKPNWVIPSLRW